MVFTNVPRKPVISLPENRYNEKYLKTGSGNDFRIKAKNYLPIYLRIK